MKTINIHAAKTTFSSIIARIERSGEGVTICRNGEPIADLVPHKKTDRTKIHPILSKIKINYDPTEPADEDEWPESAR